jgi:hypothetical protein
MSHRIAISLSVMIIVVVCGWLYFTRIRMASVTLAPQEISDMDRHPIILIPASIDLTNLDE